MVFPLFFVCLPGRVSLQPTQPTLSWVRLASNCQININVYFDTQGTVAWTPKGSGDRWREFFSSRSVDNKRDVS